jgi:hypothetical protein
MSDGQLEPCDIFQRFSSSWSLQPCTHDPTSSISRGPCLSHFLICIFFRTCARLMSVRYMPFRVLYRSLLPKITYL